MSESNRKDIPTLLELRDKYNEIFNDQYKQVVIIQEQLDDINHELKTIRLIMPSMRSPKTRNQLGKREIELIQLGTKLNESRTILFMALLQPMVGMAKLLAFDSEPSEPEAPPAHHPQISDEELKSMYQKYED